MSESVESRDLVEAACQASAQAYAPYSGLCVGAALLTGSGRVFSAANVENASYGLTMCAERAAVFKALSEGERDHVAMAISFPGGGTPCGACRQVLHEFNPELMIFISDDHQKIISKYHLSDLLPNAFEVKGEDK